MSCILRVVGTKFDFKELGRMNLIPDSTWEKDAPRLSTKPDGKKNTNSGATFVVSDAEFDDFEQQKYNAIDFLKRNKHQIQEILNFSGIEGAVLDFGIYWRNVPVQCDHFPAELVKLAGELGLGLELTQYPPDEDGEK